jgi:pimeloyl-ACP methyl ester carboxylesterase
MFGLPLPLLTLASRGMLRDPARRAMASALPEDFALVRAEAGRVSDYALLHCRTLLIDGTATRPYLRKAVAALAATIPGAEHVELPGQWHSVTQNRDEYGRPDTVAPALIRFFAE